MVRSILDTSDGGPAPHVPFYVLVPKVAIACRETVNTKFFWLTRQRTEPESNNFEKFQFTTDRSLCSWMKSIKPRLL